MSHVWDSMLVMRRASLVLAIVATASLAVGIVIWPVSIGIAIAACVVGTASILLALFAWFRFDHLRELERLRR